MRENKRRMRFVDFYHAVIHARQIYSSVLVLVNTCVNMGEIEPSHCDSFGEHKREPCYIQGWSRIAFHLSLRAAPQKINSHLKKIINSLTCCFAIIPAFVHFPFICIDTRLFFSPLLSRSSIRKSLWVTTHCCKTTTRRRTTMSLARGADEEQPDALCLVALLQESSNDPATFLP